MYHIKCFAYINPFMPYNNPLLQTRNSGTEWLNNFPKVTQLVSISVRI